MFDYVSFKIMVFSRKPFLGNSMKRQNIECKITCHMKGWWWWIHPLDWSQVFLLVASGRGHHTSQPQI